MTFSDRVKPKVTNGKPPRVTAKTEYTKADLIENGKPVTVDDLCDESSTVCLVACDYAVASIFSKSVANNGKTYITSDSVDPTSVQPPPKPPGNVT
jgi:hypothetical protein